MKTERLLLCRKLLTTSRYTIEVLLIVLKFLKADKTEVEKLQARISKLEEVKKEQDKVLIMRESYEKRFNVLIHGIPVQEESAWETPLQTLGLIHTFMKKGLRFEDPTLIPLADYHRLPQRPIHDRMGA